MSLSVTAVFWPTVHHLCAEEVIPELSLLQILCTKVDKHITMSLSFPTVIKSNHRSFAKDRDCKSFKRQSRQDVNTHDRGERKAGRQL